MNVTIYHNTRCSKSRSALQILENKGIKPTIINYQESPPSKEYFKRILKSLKKYPQEIIRFNEKLAKEMNLSPDDNRDLDEWLEIMINNPILIERPIVTIGEKAVLGRPPENVLSIL